MKAKDGDLILIVLDEGREIVGVWGDQTGVDIGYLKLYNAVLVGMMNTPKGPQKGFIPSDEGGNFSKDLFVLESKIVAVKFAVPGSEFYNTYIEATTGIKPPTFSETSVVNRRAREIEKLRKEATDKYKQKMERS